jgi:hypothetical protein
LVGVASSAGAQQLVAFGAAEFSGQRRSVQLLGFALGSGLPGWSPVLTVTGLHFTFPSVDPVTLVTSTADAWAIAPSLGMRYQTDVGSTGVHVGYIAFTGETPPAGGTPVGASDGIFATVQADYWGRGEAIGQLLATYNFGGEYLWSRAKGAVRVAAPPPIFLGAEAILQGGGEGPVKPWALQLGPVVAFQLTPNFRLDLSGGVRLPLNRDESGEFTTGYGRIEFVAVLPRFVR